MPAAHAERLAARIDERLGAQRHLQPFDRGREARVVLDHVRAGDDVDRERLADRLAGVARFDGREFVVAFAQQVDRAAQDARALHRGHRGPFALAFPSGRHGAVDVGRARLLHLREQFAGGGIEGVESLAAGGVDVTAADVEALQTVYGHEDLLEGDCVTRQSDASSRSM
ncbi:hypothetical protein BA763_18955 [Burkholderia cenocepacia]|nr:hypothetical protein BA763_18955 [Burkholderia cenocepacia]